VTDANGKQIPVMEARDFIREIIDRCRMQDGTRAAEATLVLPTVRARNLWWVVKWLEIIGEWPVQQTDFSLDYCGRMLVEMVNGMKGQKAEEKILVLTRRDMLMLMDVEQHLDNFTLMREFDQLRKEQGETKKKKRNGAR
jgi:hypothetical protein